MASSCALSTLERRGSGAFDGASGGGQVLTRTDRDMRAPSGTACVMGRARVAPGGFPNICAAPADAAGPYKGRVAPRAQATAAGEAARWARARLTARALARDVG